MAVESSSLTLMKGLIGKRRNGSRFSLRMFALSVLFFFKEENLPRDCSMTLMSSRRWVSLESGNDEAEAQLLFMTEREGDLEKSSGDTDETAGIDRAELLGETLLDGDGVVFLVTDMWKLPCERSDEDRECVLLFAGVGMYDVNKLVLLGLGLACVSGFIPVFVPVFVPPSVFFFLLFCESSLIVAYAGVELCRPCVWRSVCRGSRLDVVYASSVLNPSPYQLQEQLRTLQSAPDPFRCPHLPNSFYHPLSPSAPSPCPAAPATFPPASLPPLGNIPPRQEGRIHVAAMPG